MGKKVKTLVLNEGTKMNEVNNVFITDGSCMASSAGKKPFLTLMA